MKTVSVKASHSYDIVIGKGILSTLGERCLDLFGKCRAVIVTDSNIAPLWLEQTKNSLEEAGINSVSFVFEAGENSKNPQTLFELLEFMAENSLTRSDFAVALGGGVTGDMTGLAASLYLRGVPFVQVPTSLLAAVDSSVGGKTAVNLDAGKNLAGTFYQPSLVLCDTETLGTLPANQFANGMAEVIKYGVIYDKKLFDKVSGGRVEGDMEAVIARCVELKRDVVAIDEFDRGERQLLNFGHTIGHAVEKCSGFSMEHGNAVAIGMVIAAQASYNFRWSEEDCTPAILAALESNHLPCRCGYSPKALAQAACSDKKRAGGVINFVVPLAIGKCVLKEIPVEMLEKIAQFR